jgi:hypothetical protein
LSAGGTYRIGGRITEDRKIEEEEQEAEHGIIHDFSSPESAGGVLRKERPRALTAPGLS